MVCYQYGDVGQYKRQRIYIVFSLFNLPNKMSCTSAYYCLLTREQFSYSVVWWGIVYLPLWLYIHTIHRAYEKEGGQFEIEVEIEISLLTKSGPQEGIYK
jgi:hypothetical protein